MAVQTLPDVSNLAEIPRKVWTREEAHLLADLGFPNAGKLELIEGELINRMGKKHPHVLWQHLILAWLQLTFGTDYVRMEAPIDVSAEDNQNSEPEPDLIVTSRSIRDFQRLSPRDLRLVIEISDASLRFDLQRKSKLYARAEIPEYWVVDIARNQLYVHREPRNGAYSNMKIYNSSETVSPLADPNAIFCLDRL